MFTGISWGNFIIGFALLSVLWYGYVLIRYYQAEIKKLVKSRKIAEDSNSNGIGTNFFIEEQQEVASSGSFGQWQDTIQGDVELLMRKIKEIILQASQTTFNKEEFKNYLKLLLREFSSLKGSDYQGAINEFTANECSAKGFTLTQGEIDNLW